LPQAHAISEIYQHHQQHGASAPKTRASAGFIALQHRSANGAYPNLRLDGHSQAGIDLRHDTGRACPQRDHHGPQEAATLMGASPPEKMETLQ